MSKKLFLALSLICLGAIAADIIDCGCIKLTPEASALVRKLGAEATYKPHTDHIYLFPRAQLKYGLEDKNYIHKWYDRPLMQDSSLEEEKGHLICGKAWPLMHKCVMDSKMDGFAAFIFTSRREDIIERSRMPGFEMPVLIELPFDESSNGLKRSEAVAKRALDMPNSFRIDGKVVLTRYPVKDNFDFFVTLKKYLTDKYGDKFILMPYASFMPFDMSPQRSKPLDTDEINKIREYLRSSLRKTDGIHISDRTFIHNRRFNRKVFDEILTPIVQSVYSEPEFKNKYLGAHCVIGHENSYRFNYTIDSTGTTTLRNNLEAIANLRPDFVIMPEWDEENENTFFRPTVANGFSTMRIVRYYADYFAGRKPTPKAGDDTAIPNLILSYRKTLNAGEPLELEVANVPDCTFADKRFNIFIRLKNAQGTLVKSFQPQMLSANESNAIWFIIPSSQLVQHQTLLPELLIQWQEGQMNVTQNLFPIEIRANWNQDYKWVKQCLRDMPQGITSSYDISQPRSDGLVEVTGKISSPVPLRSVEILEGHDTIFMAGKNPQIRENDTHYAIQVQIQALIAATVIPLNGTITWKNMPGIKSHIVTNRKNAITTNGENVWNFTNANYSNWLLKEYVMIPKEEAKNGIIEIAMAPHFTGKLFVSDIISKGIFALSGPGGGSMVFTRFVSQETMPVPLMEKTVDFKFLMRPNNPASVLRLQAITEDYKVYYGASKSFYRPSGEMRTIHVYERDLDTVSKISVDKNLLSEPHYDFSPTRGSVLYTNAGHARMGILNGYAPLVTGFGQGESGYGNLLAKYITPKTPGWPDCTPRQIQEPDGSYSLQFSNCSFATLPLQFIPPYTGFTLEMKVWPGSGTQKQTLLSTGINAFILSLTNYTPTAFFFFGNNFFNADNNEAKAQITANGPPLKKDAWNQIKVIFDQKEIVVEVNGVKGTPVKASGYMLYPRATALGANHKTPNFFNGKIADVKITVQ